MRKRHEPGFDLRRRLALAGLLLAMLFPWTAQGGGAGVVHIVLLWLEDSGNDAQRMQLIAQTERLRTVPGVVDLRVGEVVASERPIVDDSFDIGIYFYFDSVEAMNRYLAHPLHRRIVKEEIAPLVSRIRVYDFTPSPAVGEY